MYNLFKYCKTHSFSKLSCLVRNDIHKSTVIYNKFFSHSSCALKNIDNRYGFTAKKKKSTVYYIGAIGILAVGLSYAAVPLYRIFCQVSFPYKL